LNDSYLNRVGSVKHLIFRVFFLFIFSPSFTSICAQQQALNILLCPLLIYGFDLGLKGAAIATTIGRGAGVLYQVYFLFVKPGVIRFKQSNFRP